MSRKNKSIKTDLAELIATMKIDASKDSIAVLDVEANRLVGGGGLIFDFGYGFTNPFTKKASTPYGSLIYEAIKDPMIISEIEQWEKVYTGGKDGVYDFYKMLKAEGWWDSVVIPKLEIDRRIAEKITLDSKKHQDRLSNVIIDSYDKIQNLKTNNYKAAKRQGSTTQKWIRNRRVMIYEATDALNKIEEFLQVGDNLKELIKSGAVGEDTTYKKLKSDVYTEIYDEQKKSYDWIDYSKDKVLFNRLNLKYDIRRWREVITEFADTMDAKDDLLAITSYNIGAEKRFVNKTSKEFNTPEYKNILDDYSQICMMNMVRQLQNVDVGQLLNGIESYDNEKTLAVGLAQALESHNLKDSIKFKFLYENMYNIEDYKQSHTATGDVKDEMEALNDILDIAVIPYLEREL